MASQFDRTERLIGKEGLERLKAAHVAVFGIGGVGGFACEALARAGVGRLTLIDFDDVDVTNIKTRQNSEDRVISDATATSLPFVVLVNEHTARAAHRHRYPLSVEHNHSRIKLGDCYKGGVEQQLWLHDDD